MILLESDDKQWNNYFNRTFRSGETYLSTVSRCLFNRDVNSKCVVVLRFRLTQERKGVCRLQ